MNKQVLEWAADERDLQSAAEIAHGRIESLANDRPGFLVTSVGRVTEQKVRILLEQTSLGGTALERILSLLGKQGILVLLGTGDLEYERRLRQYSVRCPNFVFLCGYADRLADKLYASGDLFLMPSSYEPCGISQMLAMRAGQPCLVHAVGGLKDTVSEGQGGFTFKGKSPVDQADQLVTTFERAFKQFTNYPSEWKKLRMQAAAQRFTWDQSVDAYLSDLYT
jgi:starch synthase